MLPSIGNEILKSIIAQHDAEELITQREVVSEKIATTMEKRAKDFHITLDDVSLTQLRFGAAFTAAVEQKQVAEQLAEQARYNVERATFEKDASIIRAQVPQPSTAALAVGRAPSVCGFEEFSSGLDV